MIRFSREYLRDRIYACWVGKNIGGTLGTPFEGRHEMADIQGFTSPPGEPLPNDDLDLQLVWLRAVEENGPWAINAKLLGEYWLSYINPNWNEYGVGKANMRDGILPPMSGEIDNDEWKNSNGAWIRSEIWASLYPGLPGAAVRKGYEDASVDHGLNEGTWAAMFTASMESAAFVIHDRDTLLDIGLSHIPKDCRVARSVNLVRDAYREGIPWRQVRPLLVQDSADLGWFQAPSNIGYVVLGLLYGENDFKKSLICAVDCTDDADCTGATLGALLGIINGMEGIPEDWRNYIGDGIVSKCMTNGHGRWPESCTELTDRVMALLPVTLYEHRKWVSLGEENDFSDLDMRRMTDSPFTKFLSELSPYSFRVSGIFADVTVEFEKEPVIQPLGELRGSITMTCHTLPEQKHYHLDFQLPEGFGVQCRKNLFTPALNSRAEQNTRTDFIIRAGEDVQALNRGVIRIDSPGRVDQILVPLVIRG